MNLHLEGPQGSELPWVLYAMSLADVPWNHPGPLNHPLPARQGSTTNLYHHHSPHSSAFCNSGYSHLPSAVYPGNSSFFNMNTLSTEEMERFQKLSNEFEPDIQVGPPQPWTDNANNQAVLSPWTMRVLILLLSQRLAYVTTPWDPFGTADANFPIHRRLQ